MITRVNQPDSRSALLQRLCKTVLNLFPQNTGRENLFEYISDPQLILDINDELSSIEEIIRQRAKDPVNHSRKDAAYFDRAQIDARLRLRSDFYKCIKSLAFAYKKSPSNPAQVIEACKEMTAMLSFHERKKMLLTNEIDDADHIGERDKARLRSALKDYRKLRLELEEVCGCLCFESQKLEAERIAQQELMRNVVYLDGVRATKPRCSALDDVFGDCGGEPSDDQHLAEGGSATVTSIYGVNGLPEHLQQIQHIDPPKGQEAPVL